MSQVSAAERWAAELAAWRIPDEILAAAPESPFGFPVHLFRVDPAAPSQETPSRSSALAALPAGGSVLDVGCGGGAASLALVPPAGFVCGVDSSAEMLAEFAAGADRRSVKHQEVRALWPDEPGSAPVADVVVCHHLFYNIPDLPALALALTSHARRRVVVELTARHPLTETAPLWWRFHRLRRPEGPTAALAGEVLAEAGLDVHTESFQGPPRQLEPAAMVEFTRRRLCLPASFDEQIAEALADVDPQAPRDLVAFWWDGGAGIDRAVGR